MRRVHHRLDLGHPVVEGPNPWHRIRQSDARLVIEDNATERGQLVEERLELGHGPEQLDVADHRPHEDELHRPVAEHLMGDAEIAASRISGLGHGPSVN